MRQIGSFYTGAMAHSREITMAPLRDRVDMVLIGATDPAWMVAVTQECRDLGMPFVADVSQQVTRMEGPEIRRARHGRALPDDQRLRARAAAAQDGLDGGRGRRPGGRAGHDARGARRADRRARLRPDQGRRGAGDRQGRPDRRRRRVPRRVPRGHEQRPVAGAVGAAGLPDRGAGAGDRGRAGVDLGPRATAWSACATRTARTRRPRSRRPSRPRARSQPARSQPGPRRSRVPLPRSGGAPLQRCWGGRAGVTPRCRARRAAPATRGRPGS